MISLSIRFVALAPYSFMWDVRLNLSAPETQVIGADSTPLTDLPSQSVPSWGCLSGLGYLQTVVSGALCSEYSAVCID